MRVDGNYVFEEILNSLTHGLGFIFSVVGMILLMSAAAAPGATVYHFWSCLLFSLCLTILYLSSTLYHSFFMLPYAKDILQVRLASWRVFFFTSIVLLFLCVRSFHSVASLLSLSFGLWMLR